MADEEKSKIFEKNLSDKARADQSRMLKEIGDSVNSVLERFGIRSECNFTIEMNNIWSDYDRKYKTYAKFEKGKENRFVDHFEQKALSDFTEALNNFAWAVQNSEGNR